MNIVPSRFRISLAVVSGLIACCLSWLAQTYVSSPGADFLWAMKAGADLISGRDVYRFAPGPLAIPYPLPAALVGLPFSSFAPAVGAALFFGLSTGLLAFGLTKNNRYSRLLIFASTPFWFALIYAQWTPLVMAAAFFRVVFPVVLIKPQIALPVALTNVSRLGVYCCIAVLLISLLIYPRWPLVWVSQIGQYQRFFPVLTSPIGPILLLALLRWRDKDAQLFLIASLLPQRYYYDAFVLWLIPKTSREIYFTTLLSSGAAILRKLRPNSLSVAILSCTFFFFPMLIVILSRRNNQVRVTA